MPGPRCEWAGDGAGLAVCCRQCVGTDAVVAADVLVVNMRGIVHACDMLWATCDLALGCD